MYSTELVCQLTDDIISHFAKVAAIRIRSYHRIQRRKCRVFMHAQCIRRFTEHGCVVILVEDGDGHSACVVEGGESGVFDVGCGEQI